MSPDKICNCGKRYWPAQAWMHGGCAINAVEVPAINNQRTANRRDRADYNAYMREYMRKKRMKPASSGGAKSRTGHKAPMPGVKNSMAGPKGIAGKGAPAPTVKNQGQTKGSHQGGSTSPKTDSGGGVGNTTQDLHRYLGK